VEQLERCRLFPRAEGNNGEIRGSEMLLDTLGMTRRKEGRDFIQ